MTEGTTVPVQRADIEKVLDVLTIARKHHEYKDRMNAATHMTPMRPSPLTTSLGLAEDRLKGLLEGLREHEEDGFDSDSNGQADADADARDEDTGVVQGAGG